MKRIITVAAVVVVALGAWFFVGPLFVDETVDEPFDYRLADGGVDLDKVMAMPEADRQAMMNEIMQTAAEAPDRRSMEDMPVSATALSIGLFQDADELHMGRGAVTLYALSDGRHVLRFENFRTTNGPDLHVYLAKHKAPAVAADVTDNGYVSLGRLKGNVGDQNYAVPADVDIEAYQSVVIWCELFGVLFSPARLIPLEA